jgi:preprotein translocase subunit SecF
MAKEQVRPSQIDFLGKRIIAVWLSGLLSLASIVSLAVQGLNLAIDFTGGILVEVSYSEPADLGQVRERLKAAGFSNPMAQNFGTVRDVLIRLAPLERAASQDLKSRITEALSGPSGPKIEVQRVEVVGPQVGEDLAESSLLALLLATLGILVYVAWRFEYRFALGAILATLHDVTMILGIFSVLRMEFDLSVLAAVLAIMGYSLNDTIVVFDRIRENFRKVRRGDVIDVMNLSINETLSRTLMTSFLTFVTVAAMAVWGGEIIHNFAVALMIGIVVGTYSSIYVASALALRLGVSRADLLVPDREGMVDDRP